MAEENWRQSLPPEYQNNDSLAKFKDIGGMVKSYLDLERFVGTTGRVPRDDSKPEDWDSYYKYWGRPEKPEYKVPDLPQEYTLDNSFKSDIQKFAHELGLNQKQFDKMINWGLTQSQGIFQAQQLQRLNETNELKKKWGYRFDANRDRARRTIAQLVNMKKDHPFVKWLESTGNDENPTVLDFFYDVANQLGEDNFVDEQTKTEVTEREEAGKKIRAIMADPKHPYFDDNNPMHKDAVAEMAKLYEIAYPSEG